MIGHNYQLTRMFLALKVLVRVWKKLPVDLLIMNQRQKLAKYFRLEVRGYLLVY